MSETPSGDNMPRPLPVEKAWLLHAGDTHESLRVICPLGRGGMGEVYAVEDERTGLRFALKLLTVACADADFWEKRFGDVAAAMLPLSHPNIGKVLRTGRLDCAGRSIPYLLMALVAVSRDTFDKVRCSPDALLGAEGLPRDATPVPLSAADLLGARRKPSEALLERLFADVSAGLRYLHDQGVVHGDVKPGNILLSAKGHATLVDFGMARIDSEALRPLGYEVTDVAAAGRAILGTSSYLAPELLRGEPRSPASDLYALGATFFLLHTRVPYGSAAAHFILDDLPERWQTRFRTLMAANPAARHWPKEEETRPRRGRRRWLAAALALGIVAGSAVSLLRPWQTGEAADSADVQPLRLSGDIPAFVEPGTQAMLLPPTRLSDLPDIQIGRNATLTFPMEGQTWTLRSLSQAFGSTLTLQGPGKLAIPVRQDTFRNYGTLALTSGATAALSGNAPDIPFAVKTEQGCALLAELGANRKSKAEFSRLDMGDGGEFIGNGKRFFVNHGADAPILLGKDARFSAHWVSLGGAFCATKGTGFLAGMGHVYGDLALWAKPGATLRVVCSGFFMYDYWKQGEVTIPSDNAGTVILESAAFVPLCAFHLRGGSTLLRGDFEQNATTNWCENKTSRAWHVYNGATFGGNATMRFSGDAGLVLHGGATLEGGENGQGVLEVNRLTLDSGAVLRANNLALVKAGSLHLAGAPLRIDASRAQPGPILVWKSLDGGPLQPEPFGLPDGLRLRTTSNSLVVEAIP